MAKFLVTAAVATILWMPQAQGQSILQRGDWHGTKLEAYLSSPINSAPWLNLGAKTKLPKSDFPLGGEAGSFKPLIVWSGLPHRQTSSTVPSDLGRCSHE
jgi:hypothetical protein